ncbi:MAG: hypothetical protein AAB656_03015 [Patescibacteria group bacterium]
MSSEILNTDKLKERFLNQPTTGVITDVLVKNAQTDSVLRDRFKWIGISGSKARQAEMTGNNGVISDDDLVIILGGNEKNDPLNIDAYDRVLDSINEATEIMMTQKGIVPVYASTIRLEDAQMAIAKMSNRSDLPLKMIHSLIYPSPEAVVAFEPPMLARNLVGQALMLWGNPETAQVVESIVRENKKVENENLTIGGLDGISDNFRMLRTNKHILPALFLGPQAVHVLDYSLKWAMAQIVEKSNGTECGTWKEIIENFPSADGGHNLIEVVQEIRQLRSQDNKVDLAEVENLYRKVILLWPLFTSFRSK